MSHTPEPWRVEYDPAQKGDPLTLIMQRDAEMYEKFIARCEFERKGDGVKDCTPLEAQHNAKRIVACVNFCAGIDDTEWMEGKTYSELFYAIKEQRDKLLRACEAARPHIEIGAEIQVRLNERIGNKQTGLIDALAQVDAAIRAATH